MRKRAFWLGPRKESTCSSTLVQFARPLQVLTYVRDPGHRFVEIATWEDAFQMSGVGVQVFERDIFARIFLCEPIFVPCLSQWRPPRHPGAAVKLSFCSSLY